MYFCRSWFRYVLVFWNLLHDIFSIKFYTISFLCKHNFFIGEKHTQWMLDTKVKVFYESISCFMKWPRNCISWNPLKEKFHSVSLPLNNSKTFLFLFFFDAMIWEMNIMMSLTHSMPLVSFCTPWKQKTIGFPMISEGMKFNSLNLV